MNTNRVEFRPKLKVVCTCLLFGTLILLIASLSAASTNAAEWTPSPTATQPWWQPTATKDWSVPATPAWQPSPTPVPTRWVAPTATITPTPTSTPTPVPAPPRVGYQVESALPYTIVEVKDRVLVGGAKNFGINVGARDQFGAAQIIKNIIPNPGFESAELATIFLTAWGGTSQRLQADNWDLQWNNYNLQIGHPPGYWNGATFEVLSGAAKGRTGSIEKFTHEDGRPTYYLNNAGRAPNGGDVVIVRHSKAGYFQKRPNGYNQPVVNDVRPGSPGVQSLLLLPSRRFEASYIESFDSLSRDGDTSAGKLLLINGRWHLEFWAKAENAGDKLRVQFRRPGERTFFDQNIWLTTEWKQYVREFDVSNPDRPQNSGSYSPITLEMRIPPGDGKVWIDDISLYRMGQTNPTVFTDKYVDLLKELEPGILRNWGEQLGSSLDNQLAVDWARKTTGHSPLSQLPADFHYSLHDFLELSHHVRAEPWYVIPPTFSRTELQNLIAYLSAPAGSHPYADLRAELGQRTPWTAIFGQIHLEYGNEMWGGNDGGDQFIGATVRGGERLGDIAGERLGMLRSSPYFVPNRYNLIIGGQEGFPARQSEIESRSSTHDTIALAPYYGDLNLFATDEQRYYPLFANPFFSASTGDMAQSRRIINNYRRGTDLAIYEINLHTTFGNTPLDVRNDFITGLNSGLALPLHMLTYQRQLGVRNQVAFTSAQYSVPLANGSGFARLWGLLRDIEGSGLKRPTWLGLDLANQAIRTNVIETAQSGRNPTWQQAPINEIGQQVNVPYVQSFAFRKWNDYSLVLFNLNIQFPEKVRLQLPRDLVQAEATMYTLSADSIHADNENYEQVRIKEETITIWDNIELVLPPHSMIVLEWKQ